MAEKEEQLRMLTEQAQAAQAQGSGVAVELQAAQEQAKAAEAQAGVRAAELQAALEAREAELGALQQQQEGSKEVTAVELQELQERARVAMAEKEEQIIDIRTYAPKV